MKNLIKEKESFEKLDKYTLLDHIREQIKELECSSIKITRDRSNFEHAAWAYEQAYEIGFQAALHKLENIIERKND